MGCHAHRTMDVASTRFVRFPGESITLCGEGIGVQVSQEIEELLVEDVSYRTRQIAHVACQFMHHANRTILTTEDLDKALKWTNTEPVYGHCSPAAPEFQLVNDGGLYSLTDREVGLVDIAHDNPIKETRELLTPINVSASWLAVEGLSLLNEEGVPVSTNGSTIELKPGISEAQYGYLSLLMEGVSGEKEDIRQVALHDLQSTTTPANILPFLFQYIQETIMSWRQFEPLQLVRFLRMVIALFRNQSLFLDPYAGNALMQLHGMLMDSTYLHSTLMYTHWHVRELTACAIAEVIRKCNNPLSDYQKELLSSFTQVLSTYQTLPFPITYGIVFTLCYLGGKSISTSLLPVLAPMSSHIQEQLQKSSPFVQQDALRVYNTLLTAAEILLISSCDLSHDLSQQLEVFQQVLMSDTSNILTRSEASGSENIDLTPNNWRFILYEFLVELFGERLLLMLELRKRCSKNSVTSDSTKKTDASPTANEYFGPNLQACVDEAFRRHQLREGFVSLHHLVSSQRLVTMKKPVPTRSMNCHPFCIRMYRLPIIHNVLEMTSSPATAAFTQGSQRLNGITKGKLKGRRRPLLASSSSCNSGVCSYWL